MTTRACIARLSFSLLVKLNKDPIRVPCTISDWVRLSHLIVGAYERGYSRYISRGPGEPRRVCESLMDPIAYAIDILFWYFHLLVYIQHSWGPKAVLSRLAKFLLEALPIVLCLSIELFKTTISSVFSNVY